MEVKCVICEDVIGDSPTSVSGIPFGEKGKYICSSCMNGIKSVMNQLGPTLKEQKLIDEKINKLAKKIDKNAENAIKQHDRIHKDHEKLHKSSSS